MNLLLQQLRKIGLNNYEAMIYALLIEHSPAGASFLAKHCKLPRSSVYTSLTSLINKGLVAVTYQNNVKQFVAQDFTALEHMLENQKKENVERFALLEEIQEQYRVIQQSEGKVPQMLFFEGEEGLKKIYESMIRESPEGQDFLIMRDEFIWKDRWNFAVNSEWFDFTEGLKFKKNIKTLLLVNDSKEEREKSLLYKDQSDLSFKFLSPKKPLKNFGLYILNDVLSILSVEEENLVGIKVKNENITNNLKQIFAGLWEKGN